MLWLFLSCFEQRYCRSNKFAVECRHPGIVVDLLFGFRVRAEGVECIKLNTKEALKYDEYWAEASQGEDRVVGKDAVAFFGRATKVSKGQLRHVWEIADHRKEGELDYKQFLIALRLIAIAQRGAEISVRGLRNFVGIQLIPDLRRADPPPDASAETPSGIRPSVGDQRPDVSSKTSSGRAPNRSECFSWHVPPDVISRYDQYFASLDSRNAGFVDGQAAVTFFGKSGLPRATLKKVWALADWTRDGKLDLHEFRTAMHMITNLRAGRLRVEDLPHALDPSGSALLTTKSPSPTMEEGLSTGKFDGGLGTSARQESSPGTAHAAHAPEHGLLSSPSVGRAANEPSGPGFDVPSSPSVKRPGHRRRSSLVNISNEGMSSPEGPTISQSQTPQEADLLSGAVPLVAASPKYFHRRKSSARSIGSDSIGGPSTPTGVGRRHEPRDVQDVERAQALTTQRELENLKSEMERLRLEQANLARVRAKQDETEVEQLRKDYQKLMLAKAKAEEEAAKARLEATQLREAAESSSPRLKADVKPGGDRNRRKSVHHDSMFEENRTRSFDISKSPNVPRMKTEHTVPDDILLHEALQPSSHATARPPTTSAVVQQRPVHSREQHGLAAPVAEATVAQNPLPPRATPSTRKQSRIVADDSLSESDDDDFWGTAGVGSKPTLSTAAQNASGSSHQTGDAQFGNDLDEWAF